MPSQGAMNGGDKQPSTPGSFRIVKDVAYLAPDRIEKLDLYLPSHSSDESPSPVVIWIHGNQGDKRNSYPRDSCVTLAQAGYACASINYGPWLGYQADRSAFVHRNLADAKNAVRFIRINSAKYHLDPTRIAVAGGSAGATLALMVGLTIGIADFEPNAPYPGISSAVNAVIDFSGTSDFLTQPSLQGQLATMDAANLAKLRKISAVTYVTRNSPPILILQGRNDILSDYHQAVELDNDLTANGVSHEFILLDNVGHGFDLMTWNGQPLPRDLRPVVLAFLSRYLGPPNQTSPVASP
jgi:acetyl esterase/lipase